MRLRQAADGKDDCFVVSTREVSEKLRTTATSDMAKRQPAAGTRSVPLTEGEVAWVDETDFHLVSRYRWRLLRQGENKYAQTHIKHPDGRKTTLSMHRLIAEPSEGMTVDHRNGNGLDNRRSNLSTCTYGENLHRQRKATSSAGIKGVYRERNGRYRAKIERNGEQRSLGTFATVEEAATAYAEAERELFGRASSDVKLVSPSPTISKAVTGTRTKARKTVLRDHA